MKAKHDILGIGMMGERTHRTLSMSPPNGTLSSFDRSGVCLALHTSFNLRVGSALLDDGQAPGSDHLRSPSPGDSQTHFLSMLCN